MHDTTPRLMARLADVSRLPEVAADGCDACSVQPGETHRYPECPGATTTRAWYFTFGEEHTYPGTGEPLTQRYTAIVGTREQAIGHMRRHFADQWDGPHPTRQAAKVDQMGLTRLKFRFWPKPTAAVTR